MRYGIEIRQTHDAAGNPDARLFHHELPDRSHPDASLQDVYRFLRDLEPARTGRPGEYVYRDAERGHGAILVLGVDAHELDRLEERVQLHALERAIGMRDPYLWDRRAPGSRRSWRNPWISTILAGVLALIGLVVFSMSLGSLGHPGGDPVATWVAVGVGLALAAVGVLLGLFNLRRIQWWTRARAAVKAAGLPMPSDLRLFE